MTRRALFLLVGLVSAAGLTACASAGTGAGTAPASRPGPGAAVSVASGPPDQSSSAAPPVAPVASLKPVSPVPGASPVGPVCVVAGRERSGLAPRQTLSVPADPSAVTIVWLPGLNAQPCQSELTRSGADLARHLVADIDSAGPVGGDTPYSCPMDDGTRLRLYFTVSGQGPAESVVDVALTGCTWLSAPGQKPRWVPESLLRALRPIAPAPFRHYLSG